MDKNIENSLSEKGDISKDPNIISLYILPEILSSSVLSTFYHL